MYNDKRLKKITDKAGISLENGIRIILANHMLKKLIPKKDLVVMDVEIDKKILKKLKKIAKKLHVSIDAVTLSLLEDQVEKELAKKDLNPS